MISRTVKKSAAHNSKSNISPKQHSKESFPIVAIGASAGGLEAMTELLKSLPGDTGMAFIYVQHLSPDHKSMLPDILSKLTGMMVQEIDDMDKIKPNNVFVIPYNKAIKVTDGQIKLIPRSKGSMTITIDILFSSLAQAQKERVIGIILSGSASDGTSGMKEIKLHGGLTFAQDQTAKFPSMPQSAIATGAVDYILSPREIAMELSRLSKHPFLKIRTVKPGKEDLIDNNDPDLKTIIHLVHKSTGSDFSLYKMNTIKRRIVRRMLLNKMNSLRDYGKLLTSSSEEIEILYQDLLINVTSFFRETETYSYLKSKLLPKLLKQKSVGESLRIWVPACSTGEEAFSIAIMLLELQDSLGINTPIQIFATDLSEKSIEKARIGLYTKKDLELLSPIRIQRFFTKSEWGYRIAKTVRDICVFAPHNILADPPFSRLDFISCCNLFIYLDTTAQKKVVRTFQYALNNGGYLMVGKSEAIGLDYFDAYNKKFKIYVKKKNVNTRNLPDLSKNNSRKYVRLQDNGIKANKQTSSKNLSTENSSILENVIDNVLLSEYMPASVVINYNWRFSSFGVQLNSICHILPEKLP
jgi:two-component system, chemotaxis family, CheB/CheR fusion protein